MSRKTDGVSVALSPALPEDAGLLTEIVVDAFREEVARYGHGPRNYDSVELRRKCIEDGNRYFKIMLGGEPVGVIGTFLKGNDCRIGVAAIRPSFQNAGAGSAAFELLEREFPAVRRFILDTPYRSFRNHHFYEKLGFRKFRETLEDPATGFTLFHMEKIVKGKEEAETTAPNRGAAA